MRTLPRNFGDETYPVTMPPTPGMDKRIVKLKSRYFIPDKRTPIQLSGPTDRIYVQFNCTLTQRDLRKLESVGANLEDYVTNNTFVVEVTEEAVAALRKLPFVSGLEEIDWRDKMSESLYRGRFTEGALLGGGLVKVNVCLGSNADVDAAWASVTSRAATVLGIQNLPTRLTVAVPADLIPHIAVLPEVRYIEEATPPVPASVISGVLSGTFEYEGQALHGLFWGPYQLDGRVETLPPAEQQLKAAIRDEGPVLRIHPALSGNVEFNENEGQPVSWHSSFVAGALAGQILQQLAQWTDTSAPPYPTYTYDFAGQAFESRLRCYDFYDAPWDVSVDFNPAVAEGARVGNMSYSFAPLAEYLSPSSNLDWWLRSNPQFLATASSNNIGGNPAYWWRTVASPGTAKNVVTVGAVNWGGVGWGDPYRPRPDLPDWWVTVWTRSGSGPCADGRIKPDIVARGTEVLSSSPHSKYVQFDRDPGEDCRSWKEAGELGGVAYTLEVEHTRVPDEWGLSGEGRVYYAHADGAGDYRVDLFDNSCRLCIPQWGSGWQSRNFTVPFNQEDYKAYNVKIEVGLAAVKVWTWDGWEWDLLHNQSWANGEALGDGKVGVGTYAGSSKFDNVNVYTGTQTRLFEHFDDGVANGFTVIGGGWDVVYDVFEKVSGTSLSAPITAGSAILMIEAYRKEYGQYPTSDILKALLCNTARDVVTTQGGDVQDRPGPDYRYGFGLLDTKAAAETIYRDIFSPSYVSPGGHILTGVIEETDDELQFRVRVDEQSVLAAQLRATLAWLDPAAGAGASPALVNDIDLQIVSPAQGSQLGVVHYPFSLDRENPTLPATAERPNSVDNIEQIVVNPLLPQGDWMFRIQGAFIGVHRSQQFALVSSAGFDKVTFMNCNILDGDNWRTTKWGLTRYPNPTVRIAVAAPIAGIHITGANRPKYAIRTDGAEMGEGTPCPYEITKAYSDPACTSEITAATYKGTVYLKMPNVPFGQLSRSDNRIMVRVHDASDDSPQIDHYSPSYVVPTATDCYVSTQGSDEEGDGSRDYPFRTISHAISTVTGIGNGQNPIRVNVAGGTYNERVTLVAHVQVCGSYDPDTWQRSDDAETIISGNGSGATVTGANNALLDGFTVTNGKFGVSCSNVSPTISECVVSGNSYHGINCQTGASPTVTGCEIRNNSEGGVNCSGAGAQPFIVNTVIHHNSISTSAGGAAVTSLNGGRVSLLNCTVAHNTVRDNGVWGGVRAVRSGSTWGSLTVVNCILWANSGADVKVDKGASGTTVSYSCIGVAVGYGGTEGNLYGTNPLLISESDLRLTALSPCIDSGDNNAQGLPERDFEGDMRIGRGPVGAIVDMGADEYHWVKTVQVVETPSGMEISWDCVWGINLYRVQYANALSLGMNWNTFPGIVDGTGLQRAVYLDTTAGGLAIRFYRVMEHQQ